MQLPLHLLQRVERSLPRPRKEPRWALVMLLMLWDDKDKCIP